MQTQTQDWYICLRLYKAITDTDSSIWWITSNKTDLPKCAWNDSQIIQSNVNQWICQQRLSYSYTWDGYIHIDRQSINLSVCVLCINFRNVRLIIIDHVTLITLVSVSKIWVCCANTNTCAALCERRRRRKKDLIGSDINKYKKKKHENKEEISCV